MITTNFIVGDIIRVHQKIQEGNKTRLQVFEGTVLNFRGRGEGKSFTVRKMVGEVAVERVWQMGTPLIERVELVGHIKRKVRRAKLSFLRNFKK